MSVLLTGAAVDAARNLTIDGDTPVTHERIAEFLRFHATEGREALVERVVAVFTEQFPYISRDLPTGTISEAVVTALFGETERERTARIANGNGGTGELPWP